MSRSCMTWRQGNRSCPRSLSLTRLQQSSSLKQRRLAGDLQEYCQVEIQQVARLTCYLKRGKLKRQGHVISPSVEARKKSFPVWKKECSNYYKEGHFQAVCRGKNKEEKSSGNSERHTPESTPRNMAPLPHIYILILLLEKVLKDKEM